MLMIYPALKYMQQGSVLQYVDIDAELLWKYSICYSILPSIYV